MKKIIQLIIPLLCMFIICIGSYKLIFKVAKNKDRIINKYREYFKLMCAWKDVDSEKIVKYLKSKNIDTIAIYGARDMAEVLYKQLSNTSISIKFFIDKATLSNTFSRVPVYSPDEKISDRLKEVDLIIVTPYMEYETIEQNLKLQGNVNVISIKDVIYGASKL